MAKLQKPPFVYMRGRLTPWDEATVHVGSEALIRGISVFEGIKGYWQSEQDQFCLLALREHYDRLRRSCFLQGLPFTMEYPAFTEAVLLLVRRLLERDRDLWLRPTVFAVEGNWGEDTVTDLVITCYHQPKKRPDRIALGVSTWQRALDNALPARIKSAANYQTGRLARMEGRRQGFDDMLLLNQWGRIAEATGSCVLAVRDGVVATPPTHEGCLESITVNLIEALCRSLDIPFVRRPLDRTELQVCDELGLVGTLMEIGIVRRLEHRDMPAHTPTLDRIADSFWACVRDGAEHQAFRLTPVV
jgi:branched-chain amino acid aminotransferase